MGLWRSTALLAVMAGVGVSSVSAWADQDSRRPRPVPQQSGGASTQCLDANSQQVVPIDDQQVVTWKATTQNEFESRGHVQGTLTQVYPDQSGHHHFEIQIGSGSAGLIEIIYNEGFDALPTLAPGMTVEACGDYITAFAASGGYQASPDGALIHWVHRTDTPKHPPGFLIINGQFYD